MTVDFVTGVLDVNADEYLKLADAAERRVKEVQENEKAARSGDLSLYAQRNSALDKIEGEWREAAAIIRSLQAEVSALKAAQQWRPIETAPWDTDQFFILWSEDEGQHYGRWDDVSLIWRGENGYECFPEFWQPLLPEPTKAQVELRRCDSPAAPTPEPTK